MKTRRLDALIVGARCAGAATSMLMARQGMRVLAIDRGGYGTDTISTHALMRGGVLQLHRWGVLPRLYAMATPEIRKTVFHYGDEAIELEIRAANGVDALYGPRRTILDRLLVDAACEAGADVRHGCVLAGLLRGLGGRVTGAVLVDEAGSRFEVMADLVIGADGVGSTVARQVNAPTSYEARHMTSVIYGYWRNLPVQAGYHWYYVAGAAAGIVPTNSGMHCVFVSVPPERFRKHLRRNVTAGFRQVLTEISPDLAEAVALGDSADDRLRIFAGHKGFLRSPYGPGWALVGDAGYFRDPLTAHGITDALRDAELLVEAAIQSTPAAFSRYADVRDDLSLPLLKASDAIASFQWDITALKQHHQALKVAMNREVAYLEDLISPAFKPRPQRLFPTAAVGRGEPLSIACSTTLKEAVT